MEWLGQCPSRLLQVQPVLQAALVLLEQKLSFLSPTVFCEAVRLLFSKDAAWYQELVKQTV